MVQSFTSPVLADPSGCLPVRPTSSSARKGMPVPSIPRYRVCGRGRESRGSVCTRSSSASSFPRPSAVLSTCLEADHGPYGADHAHNRRRERRGVHSQGPVARTEAPLTFPTVVVGTFQFQFSDHTVKTFPSSFYITRPPATGTGQRAALVIGMVAVELLLE